MTDTELRLPDESHAMFAAFERGRETSTETLDAWAAHVIHRIDDGASDLEIEMLIRHPVHRGVSASALFKAGLRRVRGIERSTDP